MTTANGTRFTPGGLREVYRHMEWADSMVWAAARALPAAGADYRVRLLLYHIHNVQHAFLCVWRGEVPRLRTVEEFATLAAVEVWARQYYRDLSVYLPTITEGALGEVLTLPWAAAIAERLGREPAESTLGDTVFQIPSHSTHHRGQLTRGSGSSAASPPSSITSPGCGSAVRHPSGRERYSCAHRHDEAR